VMVCQLKNRERFAHPPESKEVEMTFSERQGLKSPLLKITKSSILLTI
jgi:hypothetical protein